MGFATYARNSFLHACLFLFAFPSFRCAKLLTKNPSSRAHARVSFLTNSIDAYSVDCQVQWQNQDPGNSVDDRVEDVVGTPVKVSRDTRHE